MAKRRFVTSVRNHMECHNRVLASCFVHMGRLDEAREIVGRLRAITPDVMEPGTRYRNPELRELFLSGLRLAASQAD